MTPIIAHVQHEVGFHVIFGVAIREYTTHFDGKLRRTADLMLFRRGMTLHEFGVQHYTSLISASYWVTVPELGLLESDVKRDHERAGSEERSLRRSTKSNDISGYHDQKTKTHHRLLKMPSSVMLAGHLHVRESPRCQHCANDKGRTSEAKTRAS